MQLHTRHIPNDQYHRHRCEEAKHIYLVHDRSLKPTLLNTVTNVSFMRIHLNSDSQFPSKGSTQSELADYGTRRLVKPFNSHETVTPSKYAKTTHMHRCQRSGLASTAIQTCYSALRKENSIRLSAFQSTGLDANIYLCVSLASTN